MMRGLASSVFFDGINLTNMVRILLQNLSGKWFAIFRVEKRVKRLLPNLDNAVGIDLGIKSFAFLSDGQIVQKHTYLRKAEKKLNREQRRLSHMGKGSKNGYKQLEKVQKIHTKAANQCRDFLHKQSYRMAETYTLIVITDLKIWGNRKIVWKEG